MSTSIPDGPLPARYRDLRPLGRGATGVVSSAWDTLLGERVAIKQVHTPTEASVQRLKREFRRLRELSHPNLVRMHELWVDGDTAFFTMDLVPGAPLDESLRADTPPGAPLPPEHAAACAEAFLQLVAGLGAAHEAGLLHRDLKPANVLRRADGGVVVLDFDLSAAPHGVAAEPDPAFAGTAAWLAPEALLGEASEASDVYALGVMLYEVLAGRLPYDGDDAITRKLLGPPHAPLTPHAGGPLAHLAEAMLLRDPADRPTLPEVARALRAALGDASTRPLPRPPGFVGREAALGQLRAAATAGHRVLLLRGPSGIGKSSLAERFLRDAVARGARCLRSRCHPDEHVPYRAFDSIRDSLRPDAATHPDSPSVSPPVATPVDPGPRAHARQRAWAELRDGLTATAAGRPLWLWIDDAQWADADSLDLLSALVEDPPPGCSFLLSFRSEADDATFGTWLRRLERPYVLDLRPLSTADLLRLGEGRADPARVEAAAEQSQGHPLFFLELLRSPTRGELDALIDRRTSGLDPEAQRLLAAACVSVQPLPVDDLLLLADAGRATARDLVHQALLRVVDDPTGRALAPHHDRIADGVLRHLPPEELAGWHARLAAHHATRPAPDPERMLRHLLGAGRTDEAAAWARAAAVRADRRHAFHRAVELYTLILEHGWAESEPATRARLGDAAAMTEHTQTAIEHYRWLLQHAASPTDRMMWRARVVAQQLGRGDLTEGLPALAELLDDLGVRTPRSAWTALAHSLGYRMLLAVRGTALPVRPPPDEVARLRLQLLWVSAATLAIQDPAIGDALGARLAWEAVRSGDPRAAATALAFKAGADAIVLGRRGRKAAPGLLEQARSLAAGSIGEAVYCEAVEAPVRWSTGEWALSLASADAFLARHHLLRNVVPVIMTSILPYRYAALAHQGNLADLAYLPRRYRRAIEAGDEQAGRTELLGWPTLGWLWAGEANAAAHEVARHLAALPTDRFLTPHYHGLISEALLHLYGGDPAAAHDRLTDRWAAFRRSGILEIEVIASEMWFLRGRVTRAAVEAGHPGARAADVADCAARVAATDLPWSRALTALLREAPAEAAALAEREGLPHLAAAARARSGDPAGVEWFRERGAADPGAMARALA